MLRVRLAGDLTRRLANVLLGRLELQVGSCLLGVGSLFGLKPDLLS